MRPRLVGAAAVALLGGLAVAATILTSPPAASLPSAKDSSAPVLPAVAATAMPSAGAVQQGSLPMDDGVPSNTDVVKAGIGHCDHDL